MQIDLTEQQQKIVASAITAASVVVLLAIVLAAFRYVIGFVSHFSGVFLPPILVVGGLALLAAWFTALALNHWRLARHLSNPPLVFLAVTALYVVGIGTFLIPI